MGVDDDGWYDRGGDFCKKNIGSDGVGVVSEEVDSRGESMSSEKND